MVLTCRYRKVIEEHRKAIEDARKAAKLVRSVHLSQTLPRFLHPLILLPVMGCACPRGGQLEDQLCRQDAVRSLALVGGSGGSSWAAGNTPSLVLG